MAVVTIPRVLEEKLGKDASAALAEMLAKMFDDERRDVLSRVDEKVAGRYSDIHRRIHEDIAGVELRLQKQMGELETRLQKQIADLGVRISDVEVRLRKEMGELEVRLTNKISDAKNSLMMWIVGSMVVQAGFMVLVAWASKHLL